MFEIRPTDDQKAMARRTVASIARAMLFVPGDHPVAHRMLLILEMVSASAKPLQRSTLNNALQDKFGIEVDFDSHDALSLLGAFIEYNRGISPSDIGVYPSNTADAPIVIDCDTRNEDLALEAGISLDWGYERFSLPYFMQQIILETVSPSHRPDRVSLYLVRQMVPCKGDDSSTYQTRELAFFALRYAANTLSQRKDDAVMAELNQAIYDASSRPRTPMSDSPPSPRELRGRY